MENKNHNAEKKGKQIRIPNELCQSNSGENGFYKLGDNSITNYKTFLVYVYLKQKPRWKKLNLNDIYNDLYVIDSKRDRGVKSIREAILTLVENGYIKEIYVDSVKDYTKQKHMNIIESLKSKSKETLTIVMHKTSRNYFSVSDRVFNVLYDCGVKEIALYLVLKKNAYKYIPVLDVNVAQYKQDVISKVVNKTRKIVRNYLTTLQDQYYILIIKQKVTKRIDGTFTSTGDSYIVIDADLDYDERKKIWMDYKNKIDMMEK